MCIVTFYTFWIRRTVTYRVLIEIPSDPPGQASLGILCENLVATFIFVLEAVALATIRTNSSSEEG